MQEWIVAICIYIIAGVFYCMFCQIVFNEDKKLKPIILNIVFWPALIILWVGYGTWVVGVARYKAGKFRKQFTIFLEEARKLNLNI